MSSSPPVSRSIPDGLLSSPSMEPAHARVNCSDGVSCWPCCFCLHRPMLNPLLWFQHIDMHLSTAASLHIDLGALGVKVSHTDYVGVFRNFAIIVRNPEMFGLSRRAAMSVVRRFHDYLGEDLRVRLQRLFASEGENHTMTPETSIPNFADIRSVVGAGNAHLSEEDWRKLHITVDELCNRGADKTQVPIQPEINGTPTNTMQKPVKPSKRVLLATPQSPPPEPDSSCGFSPVAQPSPPPAPWDPCLSSYFPNDHGTNHGTAEQVPPRKPPVFVPFSPTSPEQIQDDDVTVIPYTNAAPSLRSPRRIAGKQSSGGVLNQETVISSTELSPAENSHTAHTTTDCRDVVAYSPISSVNSPAANEAEPEVEELEIPQLRTDEGVASPNQSTRVDEVMNYPLVVARRYPVRRAPSRDSVCEVTSTPLDLSLDECRDEAVKTLGTIVVGSKNVRPVEDSVVQIPQTKNTTNAGAVVQNGGRREHPAAPARKHLKRLNRSGPRRVKWNKWNRRQRQVLHCFQPVGRRKTETKPSYCSRPWPSFPSSVASVAPSHPENLPKDTQPGFSRTTSSPAPARKSEYKVVNSLDSDHLALHSTDPCHSEMVGCFQKSMLQRYYITNEIGFDCFPCGEFMLDEWDMCHHIARHVIKSWAEGSCLEEVPRGRRSLPAPVEEVEKYASDMEVEESDREESGESEYTQVAPLILRRKPKRGILKQRRISRKISTKISNGVSKKRGKRTKFWTNGYAHFIHERFNVAMDESLRSGFRLPKGSTKLCEFAIAWKKMTEDEQAEWQEKAKRKREMVHRIFVRQHPGLLWSQLSKEDQKAIKAEADRKVALSKDIPLETSPSRKRKAREASA